MLKLLVANLGVASAFTAGHAVGAGRAYSRAAVSMASFHDFSATTLDGKEVSMSDYKGKPVLILNVASLWGTTVSDFNAMNSLAEKFGDKLTILGFPCNQFGHQTNEGNDEFLNTLKYVRPGNNFEVNPAITLFQKCDVNGADALPLFKYLKTSMMIPSGPLGDTKGNGCDDIDALVLPRGGFGGTTVTLWTPVCRSDIAWNFEKFLVGPDGEPVKRFSRYFPTAEIAADVEALLGVPA